MTLNNYLFNKMDIYDTNTRIMEFNFQKSYMIQIGTANAEIHFDLITSIAESGELF